MPDNASDHNAARGHIAQVGVKGYESAVVALWTFPSTKTLAKDDTLSGEALVVPKGSMFTGAALVTSMVQSTGQKQLRLQVRSRGADGNFGGWVNAGPLIRLGASGTQTVAEAASAGLLNRVAGNDSQYRLTAVQAFVAADAGGAAGTSTTLTLRYINI